MGTFAKPTVKHFSAEANLKVAIISTTGSASYATGGDTIDLSNGATNGFGDNFSGFAEVYCCKQVAMGAAADSKYACMYIPASGGAPATGVVKIHDTSAAADAEVTNATNLSGSTFYFLVMGR